MRAIWYDAAMKAYVIAPPFETFGQNDARTAAAIDLIADLVLRSLRQGGDIFQHAVAWADPGKEPGGIFTAGIAIPHIIPLETEEALRNWLRISIDPNLSGGGDVRSIATCRSATFGYDGQAFLCLRHEDPQPVSPDPSLATVEERSDLLVRSDYFDGWIREDADNIGMA